MKPTFLKVGIPKSPTRAPQDVKPPTEAGVASIGSDIVEWTTTDASANPTIPLPTNTQEGDLLLMVGQGEFTQFTTAISGWTDYGQIDHDASGGPDGFVLVKDATSADVSAGSVTVDAPANELAVVIWRVRGSTSTASTVDIASQNPSLSADPTPDAIPITPSAAGTYFVFTVWHANKGSFPTDQATDGPSGYSEFAAADVGGGVLAPAVYLWNRTVTITTSEAPGEFNWSSSAGSRIYAHTTIAVNQSGGDPTVVGYPVTVSDIDSESSTDGQVITSDGAGGAAWEDVSDANAIHDNVAAEISAITAKGSPVSGDYLLIEDSEDSDNKKSITIGDLPTGSTDHGALTGLADDDHSQYLNVARHDADDHSSLSLAASDLTTRWEVIVYDDGSGLEAVADEAGNDWLYTEV